MADQHYLPASYIGRFSTTNERRLRDRTVWVQRVGRQPYQASAAYVGKSRRLYDRHKPNSQPPTADTWPYEGRLPRALDALSDPRTPLDGALWAQVLVPFVSALFIRTPDFKSRFEARIPGVTGPAQVEGVPTALDLDWHDNTLGAMQIEWQRLLAPTMAAQWTVFHGSGEPILPTSDAGYCLMTPPDDSVEFAYALPLGPSTVLALVRRPLGQILTWDGVRWVASVEHRSIADAELVAACSAMKDGASFELYGPTRESVIFPHPGFVPRVGPMGPGGLLFSPRMRALIPYLEDYFRVLSILVTDPEGALEAGSKIDWSAVEKSWRSPVQIVINLPRYPGGIAMVGQSVYLHLTRFSIEDVEADLQTFRDQQLS